MKTNQIMIRDNEAFIQRTKDGYFSANVLLNRWNESNPRSRKNLNNFKINKSTVDFIKQLKTEGIDKPYISGRQGTWMHPKLFIDFAMWVSVGFKSKVIDYVLDGLIQSRHEAGDYYNEMCAAILSTYVDYYKRKPNPNVYMTEARRVKSLLNLDNKERNEMTEKELSDITALQKYNAVLIKKRIGISSRKKLLNLFVESLI